MEKRCLFLTTSNLTTNPRCYKEVKFAKLLGYHPIVLAFNLGGWSEEFERKLKSDLEGIDVFYLNATKSNYWYWIFIGISQNIFKLLSYFFPQKKSWNSFAINKRSFQLIRSLNKLDIDADIVIAHNLGAFYPAYFYSKKKGIPFGIDIEDFHPGETSNSRIKPKVENIFGKVLPKATYITFASPLIEKKVLNEYNLSHDCRFAVVNNLFYSKEFVLELSKTIDEKLHFVWFSQNIDYGRGIELFLDVLDLFANEIDLTLIGNPRERFLSYEVKARKFIKIIPAIEQIELHRLLSKFDIGLAIEDSEADENRGLCLTNKICSYLQGGLYILATDTSAQREFINDFKSHGVICSLNKDVIKRTIKTILKNSSTIKKNKELRFQIAKQFSWENESVILKDLWNSILG